MKSFRTALLVACFGIAMFHEAKAAIPSDAVTVVPPGSCLVGDGTTTWAYEEYIAIGSNLGAAPAVSSVSQPASIIVWRCFVSQAACQAAQNSTAKPAQQNFTVNIGASANGTMQVGRFALGCHQESN